MKKLKSKRALSQEIKCIEQEIKCLEDALLDFFITFYLDYKQLAYQELKELKKMYVILVGLIQIEKNELQQLKKCIT